MNRKCTGPKLDANYDALPYPPSIIIGEDSCFSCGSLVLGISVGISGVLQKQLPQRIDAVQRDTTSRESGEWSIFEWLGVYISEEPEDKTMFFPMRIV